MLTRHWQELTFGSFQGGSCARLLVCCSMDIQGVPVSFGPLTLLSADHKYDWVEFGLVGAANDRRCPSCDEPASLWCRCAGRAVPQSRTALSLGLQYLEMLMQLNVWRLNEEKSIGRSVTVKALEDRFKEMRKDTGVIGFPLLWIGNEFTRQHALSYLAAKLFPGGAVPQGNASSSSPAAADLSLPSDPVPLAASASLVPSAGVSFPPPPPPPPLPPPPPPPPPLLPQARQIEGSAYTQLPLESQERVRKVYKRLLLLDSQLWTKKQLLSADQQPFWLDVHRLTAAPPILHVINGTILCACVSLRHRAVSSCFLRPSALGRSLCIDVFPRCLPSGAVRRDFEDALKAAAGVNSFKSTATSGTYAKAG